jgi:DNA-binding MarR family transcriptional regulator
MSQDVADRAVKLLALHCNVVQRMLTYEALEEEGGALTPTQFAGLRFVALHPGACIRDMAAGLQVTHPAAVKLVERLQARGLVERAKAHEDQRRVCLRATQEGQRLWLRVRHRHRALVQQILDSLGENDARRLTDLLEHFVRTAVQTREQAAQVCLYCGVEHDRSCPVGTLEHVLGDEPLPGH